MNQSSNEYCKAYKIIDDIPNATVYKSCIENKTMEITKNDINRLTGFIKAGSKTSINYLALTGKARFKSALRKLVLQRLLKRRHDYLGVYDDSESKFNEIAKCSRDLGLEKYNVPSFKIDTQKKRGIIARAHVEAAFIIESFLSYKSEFDKNIDNINKLMKQILQIKPNIKQIDNPFTKEIEKLNEYSKISNDKTVLKILDAYKNIYKTASCKVSKTIIKYTHNNKTGQKKKRERKGPTIQNVLCKTSNGLDINLNLFEQIKTHIIQEKFEPLLAISEKYPILVSPEDYISLFVENKSVRKSRLMSRIIGDMDLNSADKASKFLSNHKQKIINSLANNNNELFDKLVKDHKYKKNLDLLLSRSEYNNIFNRTNKDYLKGGQDLSYLSPALQNYISKIDSSIIRFCDDNDLEFDYHNHPGLAEYIIQNPSITEEYSDLSVKDATITSQIAYCHLLESEPPPKGGISVASVTGFGLLAAGAVSAVAPIPGSRGVSALAFTSAGGFLTLGAVYDLLRSDSLLDQHEGYVAIGVGDILALHNHQTAHSINKVLLGADIALLSFDLALLKKLTKLKSKSTNHDNIKWIDSEVQAKTDEITDSEIIESLKKEGVPESLLLKNNKLKRSDLDELGNSTMLSNYHFDAFHDGHYIPSILKAVVKATDEEMIIINSSIRKAMKSANAEKIEEIDIFVEYALTQNHSDAISLLEQTDILLELFKTNKKLLGIEGSAAKSMKRFKKIKSKNTATSFEEQSEWLKCKSPRYQAKREAGFNTFLLSVPVMDMAGVPVSAAIANFMKNGTSAEFGKDFMQMVVSEMLFIQTFGKHFLKHALTPTLKAARKIDNKKLSGFAEAMSYFGGGFVSGGVKGYMLEQIDKLPLDKKDLVYKHYYSEDFQKNIKLIEDKLTAIQNMDSDKVLKSFGFDSKTDLDQLNSSLEEMVKYIDVEDMISSESSQTGGAAKMAIADSTFAFVNSFKVVKVVEFLSPYFCMANSSVLSAEIQKKYKLMGAALFIGQSVLTRTGYFLYRDVVMEL